MAFAIYCCDTNGLQAAETGTSQVLNRRWSSWGAEGVDTVTEDKMIDVHVRNGRFFVHLGETDVAEEYRQVAISDITFDVRPLYVVTWVAQPLDGGGHRIFRLPPQKLATVPHAVTAERANGFHVRGDLRIEGGNLHFSDGLLISAGSPGAPNSNWDYIYHEDIPDTWHFVSDTPTNPALGKASGNSNLQAGALNLVSRLTVPTITGVDTINGQRPPSLSVGAEILVSVSNGDENTSVLGPASRRMCFLTGVYVHDQFADQSSCHCRIIGSGGQWSLRATSVEGEGDPDCSCRARCISW